LILGRAFQIAAWHGIVLAIALGVLFAWMVVLGMIAMVLWAFS
jgi:hypothetical protein